MRVGRWRFQVTMLVGLALFIGGCADDDSCCKIPGTPRSNPDPTRTPTGAVAPSPTPTAAPVAFSAPAENQLSLDSVSVNLTFDERATPGSLAVMLDGTDVTDSFSVDGGVATGILTGLAGGQHRVVASVQVDGEPESAEVAFESTALLMPDECEILNNAECMLPYPSSRFLEPADTPTGFRVAFPADGMPVQNRRNLPTAPYAALDGFSPTVQILMHFPQGVDVTASNAPRLLSATRATDLRSLDADSPTLLFDADTGEQILHFIEVDVRAEIKDTLDRQALFLRPGRSLTPGHRYIVAVRNLVDRDGEPVVAESVFAALRDGRPSDIAAVNARRPAMEAIFERLTALGIDRGDLVLAFDFVVQSDQGLTHQMLSMRDQSFAWLAAETEANRQTFTVTNVRENDCAQGAATWRVVEGTYQVPLFLERDPVTEANTPAILNVDGAGEPVQNGVTNPPFTISIPCASLQDSGTPIRPIILGHGLFGDGRGFVTGLADSAGDNSDLQYIAGATDWRGLSAPDVAGDLPTSFIGRVVLDLRNFPALPDRLRQGQLNTLVLAKMMKLGTFNRDAAFQRPAGGGVLPGPSEEEFYFGASLGGIMGLMFSGLSPDIVNSHVDVPAINFSLLLERATPFLAFEGAFDLTGLSDSMSQALVLGIVHELWVRGESAGYATHITSNPLPGTNAKNILMTGALYDQQVSNTATEVAARTLNLPNLEGSVLTQLPQIENLAGPLPSALVFYDTGSFDPNNPAHAPFIPPLANLQAEPNRCDPHGLQAIIPAALDQLGAFLRPGGQVTNFCNGLCDAAEPLELPSGDDLPCDPFG